MMKSKFTLEEVKEKILNGEIKNVTVCIPLIYNVYYRRFSSMHFLETVLPYGFSFTEVLLLFNIENIPISSNTINFDTIGDNKITIDTTTFRNLSWLGPGHLICFSDSFRGDEVNYEYPRNALKQQIDRIMGKHQFNFLAASEIEYYIFKDKTEDITKNFPKIDLGDHTLTKRNSVYCLGTFMDRYDHIYESIRENIKNCGIELEALFTEHGPGQQEINIKYSDLLNNCDNHILLKQCIRHTTYENGLGCTFMAKPVQSSGSSCHLHISCYRYKTNMFMPIGNDNYHTLESQNMNIHNNIYYFIGGLLKYVQEFFLIWAPLVNSYKRYRLGSFAPYYINTWSYDNKTSAIRLLGKDESLRLEFRIPGADVNPYLLLTAVLASGMKGIENRIDPPPILEGNAYLKEADNYIAAPNNLYEAVKLFEKSEFAEEVFGSKLKDILVKTALVEWNLYMDHISSFEINRYLDLA